MQLEWRTQSEGRPVTVTLAIQEATYRSERRAHVHLTVTGVRSDTKQRRHARRGLAAPATLTAIACDRIVDGDWITATLVDISDSGVGLTTSDNRPRPGDRSIIAHSAQVTGQVRRILERLDAADDRAA
jgi:c-di-GMP-binding flagellar brake protein YcgR